MTAKVGVWMRDARGRFLAGSFYSLAHAVDYVDFVRQRPRQFQISELEIRGYDRPTAS